MAGYQAGQVIPPEEWQAIFGKRGLWAAPLPAPQWYIFTTAAQRELPAEAWLRRNGVPECWFPTETRWRNLPRGKRRKVSYLAPIAPRYLFAVLDKEPHWDVLFARARVLGNITGVVSRNGVPQPIPEAAMMQMRHVPQRLEAIRAEMEAAKRINPGDRAEIITGPLAGWTVDIATIHDGIASFVLPLLGKSAASVELSGLRKIAS